MRYMVVNLDRQQYFRPVELGAPHGSKYSGVGEAQGPHDWPWLILLSHLMESRSDDWLARRLGPWYGAWAGDRVAVVRGDDETARFLPEDLQALRALGAPGTDYQVVRGHFEDVTGA